MTQRERITSGLPREPAPLRESPQELARLVREAGAFKLALSLLSPEGPSRGFRLLQKAFQAVYDRAECAEREAAGLREELANLKQARRK